MTQPNENGFQRTASDMHNIQQDNDRIQQNTADGEPAAQLPPRPDPETGTPAPPEAPVQFSEGYNEKNARLPSPPPGKGPTLAAYRQKRLVSWASGFIPVAVLVVTAILYDGFKVLTLWPVWAILAAVYAWTVFIMRINTVSAGADWSGADASTGSTPTNSPASTSARTAATSRGCSSPTRNEQSRSHWAFSNMTGRSGTTFTSGCATPRPTVPSST